jgi:hypothetical protein
MGGRTVRGFVVMLVGIVAVGLALPTRTLPAAKQTSPAEKAKAKEDKKGISLDVVIEEVDFSANTITARATIHVLPPHDHVGGQVSMTGTTGVRQDQATKYVRLPVMPEARLKDKKPKPGLHAILRLEMLRQGSLVVVGIEEFTGVERIGVDWLDAPGTK